MDRFIWTRENQSTLRDLLGQETFTWDHLRDRFSKPHEK